MAGAVAWVESHGRLLTAAGVVAGLLKMSAEARVAVGVVASPLRRAGGSVVLWLVREKVDERNTQHNEVIRKLDALAWVGQQIPAMQVQLDEATEDRRAFRAAVVEIARSGEKLSGVAAAMERLTETVTDFCSETRQLRADDVERIGSHGERLASLEAERRTHRPRRHVDRDLVSGTEGQ